MENLSAEKIKKVLEKKLTGPAVTIYLPTHRAASPPHMSEDQTRFKNLMRRAAEELGKTDAGRKLVAELEPKAREILADKTFWEHLGEGLLICASENVQEIFNLPAETEEYVAVNEFFHLAPVIALINETQKFYVLAVARKSPKFFEGDPYDLKLTDIELPPSLEEALKLDELWQKSVQSHSTGKGGATFHGHGSSKDVSNEFELNYWRMIDQKVNARADKTAPLVLAGVEKEISEYRKISRFPKILTGTITGNYTGAPVEYLLEPARAIVNAEVNDAERRAALDNYNRLYGDKTSDKISEIAEATAAGRVNMLLIGMSRLTTDNVDEDYVPKPRLTFPKHDRKLHAAAAQTWLQGGRVFNLDESEMPNGARSAAVFRY